MTLESVIVSAMPEARDVGDDPVGDVGRQRLDLELAGDVLEHAALLDARAPPRRPRARAATVDWIFSSRRTLSRSRWTHVAPDRVALLVLDDHRLALAAVDLDVEQRVALGQHGAQRGGRRP